VRKRDKPKKSELSYVYPLEKEWPSDDSTRPRRPTHTNTAAPAEAHIRRRIGNGLVKIWWRSSIFTAIYCRTTCVMIRGGPCPQSKVKGVIDVAKVRRTALNSCSLIRYFGEQVISNKACIPANKQERLNMMIRSALQCSQSVKT
jgi:hypothetical protein